MASMEDLEIELSPTTEEVPGLNIPKIEGKRSVNLNLTAILDRLDSLEARVDALENPPAE